MTFWFVEKRHKPNRKMTNKNRKLTVITTIIATLLFAINTNADVNEWIQQNEVNHGLRIEKIETPIQTPFVFQGDFARIEARINEDGVVIQTQSLEYNNEDLAKAYEYALKDWKFESKGVPYKVVIPFVASH